MSQHSQGSVRGHIERMKKARGETSPGGGEEAEQKIDDNIASLMGFEWARIDAYTNRLAQDEEEVKKVGVFFSGVVFRGAVSLVVAGWRGKCIFEIHRTLE